MEGPQDAELGRLVEHAADVDWEDEVGAADAPNGGAAASTSPILRGKATGEARAFRQSRTLRWLLLPALGVLLLMAAAAALSRLPQQQLEARLAGAVVQREERAEEKGRGTEDEEADKKPLKEEDQEEEEEEEEEEEDKEEEEKGKTAKGEEEKREKTEDAEEDEEREEEDKGEDKGEEDKKEEDKGEDKGEEDKEEDKEAEEKEAEDEEGGDAADTEKEAEEQGDCIMEDDTDFETPKALFAMQGIASASICRQKCRDYSQCGAWTWGKTRDDWGLMNMCFIKGLGFEDTPKRHKNDKVVSGFPCRKPDDGQTHLRKDLAPPSHTLTKIFDVASLMPSSHDPKKPTKGVCFCFAVMVPGSYEQELLKKQYHLKANIFSCEAQDVYSSSVIEVTEGLKTKVVDSDLKCKFGGEFGTALNTEIFMAVWKKVISDLTFDDYKWTVKADPDTVFIYSRLINVVKDIHDTDDGVYLNNCRMGMHGPLEVFSRNSVWTWGQGAKDCFVHFYNLCSGPCLWGEDMFVDQCLNRKLHVERMSIYNLLTEEHCAPPSGWDDCKDEKSVAFHPFKKLDKYLECLGNAEPERYPELAPKDKDDEKEDKDEDKKDDKDEDKDEDKEKDKDEDKEKDKDEDKEKDKDEDKDEDKEKDKDEEKDKEREKKEDEDKDKDKDGEESEEEKCPHEDGVDYETKKALYAMEGIVSSKICRQKCEQTNNCGAWTWGKTRDVWGLTNMCFLKVLEKDDKPNKHRNPKVVSGYPCRKPRKHEHKKEMDDPSKTMMSTFDLSHGHDHHDHPQGKAASETALGTLYCWALILPGSYEEGLLRYAYGHGAHIFQCDSYAVYSNSSIQLAQGLQTSVVNTSLYCQKGGEFGTALNTDIFMRVWKKVISDGTFENFRWTLKADADTVMVVPRLRSVLEVYRETEEGVYLNNCRMGLHGPLEVFSRNAVRAWSEGSQKCFHHFYRLCSGPCLWGEDMFIDQCLEKVLKVRKVLVERLLTEDHCDPPDGWDDCKDPRRVAFHPFKKLDKWKVCNENAVAASSNTDSSGDDEGDEDDD